jgi:hypothetical protein
MKPLFYVLILESSGRQEFAGAFRSREMAEQKASRLAKPFRIEPATQQDFEEDRYA